MPFPDQPRGAQGPWDTARGPPTWAWGRREDPELEVVEPRSGSRTALERAKHCPLGTGEAGRRPQARRQWKAGTRSPRVPGPRSRVKQDPEGRTGVGWDVHLEMHGRRAGGSWPWTNVKHVGRF